jgi:hypothetical protein
VETRVGEVRVGESFSVDVQVDVPSGVDTHVVVEGTFRSGPAPWE